MKTVIVGPRSDELREIMHRRHHFGQDRYDEIWEGEYHMVPGPEGAHAYLDDVLARLLGPTPTPPG